jgi:hypothetical protein
VKRFLGFGVAVAAALVLAAGALAAKPPAYQGNGGQVQGKVQQGAVSAAKSGTLPFTGLDLALFAAGGIALVLVGASMRRAGRRRG